MSFAQGGHTAIAGVLVSHLKEALHFAGFFCAHHVQDACAGGSLP